MDDFSTFRIAIRGFDREDVITYVRRKEEEYGARIMEMDREIRRRDKQIKDLNERLDMKNSQIEHMEQDIKNKYQKYIDHYDQIGELVYRSRMEGDRILRDAKEEAKRIVEEADAEAKRRAASVQGQIDAKLKDGKEKYLAVQEEMNEIVDMLNQMQRKFMVSYKEMHEIVQSMPSSLDDINLDAEEDFSEEDEILNFGMDSFLDDEDFEDSDMDIVLAFDPDKDEAEAALAESIRAITKSRSDEEALKTAEQLSEEIAAEIPALKEVTEAGSAAPSDEKETPAEQAADIPEEISEEHAAEEPQEEEELPEEENVLFASSSLEEAVLFDAIDALSNRQQEETEA
ncbi:MAG: hypothetical protein Q4B09_03485 [Lachnospiraceae bacterium]|nr:hypothetical protein [Lachnospiraceae bacterium]